MAPRLRQAARFLFSTRGRTARTPFWIFVAASVLSIPLIEGLDAVTVDAFGAEAGVVARLAMLVATSWIASAVHTRRVHDLGRSGWYLFLPLIAIVGSCIPLVVLCVLNEATIVDVSAAIAEGGELPTDLLLAYWLAFAASVAGSALLLWRYLRTGFPAGTAGANPYGPDPLSNRSSA